MGHIHFTHCYTMVHLLVRLKVIYPKYSKHWPHTVAHTIDCVSIVMLNHGLNHSLTFQAFLMKIHSKLIKFRINIKTKLLQIYDFRSQVFTWSYSIVKDSSADLGVIFKIVQNRPTVKAVCTKISKNFFCIFVNIFVFLRENKEVSFFIFWIFKQKQP